MGGVVAALLVAAHVVGRGGLETGHRHLHLLPGPAQSPSLDPAPDGDKTDWRAVGDVCVIVVVVSDYRFAPALTARLMGLTLVGLALVVLAGTVLALLLDLPSVVLLVLVLVVLAVIALTGRRLRGREYAVRLTDEGYQVRHIRGAGVEAARWKDVEDAVTTTAAGSPCLVLRLRNGTTTTIPVEALDVDREQFVRDVQGHLDRGTGPRRR